MKKHGAVNRNLDGTGGARNPWFSGQVQKRRKKSKIEKASRKKNR